MRPPTRDSRFPTRRFPPRGSAPSITSGGRSAPQRRPSNWIPTRPSPTGRWERRNARFKEDHEEALGYFETYLEKEPDDPDGLYYFGLACIEAEAYDKISDYIIPHVEALIGETRLLPMIAQGYFFEEKYEEAQTYFERFLERSSEEEQALYADIAYAASPEELQGIRSVDG